LLERKLQLHLGDDSHVTAYGVLKYIVDVTDRKKCGKSLAFGSDSDK